MIDKIALYGLLLGMIFLWIWNWALMRILLRHERQLLDLKRGAVEQRCFHCENKSTCKRPGSSGTLFPCPYFYKEQEM